MNIFSSKKLVSSVISDFKNGVPIGHKSMNLSKKKFWHPFMTQYLLGIRHDIAIINPYITKKCVLRAFYMIALLMKQGGHVLIINTNPEYSSLSRNLSLLTLQNKKTSSQIVSMYQKYKSLRTGMISYCCYKWIGGTLTNWKQISRSVLTFAKFSDRCEKFLIKNNIEFPRYKKIRTCFEGLIQKRSTHTTLAFYEKPDAIFLLNPNENQNIIREASKLHIPVIAFTESNTNIKGITYPIPLNTYSMNFIYYCLKKLVKLALMQQK